MTLKASITLVCLFVARVAHADAPMETSTNIPLNEILTNGMPGTRNVDELKPNEKFRAITELIQQSLKRKRTSKAAGNGFIVHGDENEALQQTYKILSSGDDSEQKEIRADDKNWIVFFARDTGQYVELKDVRRTRDKISIRYRFVPHDSKESTRHFALIPLGAIRPGRHCVEIVRAPFDQSFGDKGFVPTPEDVIEKIISNSFEFTVTDAEK